MKHHRKVGIPKWPNRLSQTCPCHISAVPLCPSCRGFPPVGEDTDFIHSPLLSTFSLFCFALSEVCPVQAADEVLLLPIHGESKNKMTTNGELKEGCLLQNVQGVLI